MIYIMSISIYLITNQTTHNPHDEMMDVCCMACTSGLIISEKKVWKLVKSLTRLKKDAPCHETAAWRPDLGFKSPNGRWKPDKAKLVFLTSQIKPWLQSWADKWWHAFIFYLFSLFIDYAWILSNQNKAQDWCKEYNRKISVFAR